MRDTFEAEDVERILAVHIVQHRSDKLKWGFTNNGSYNSQSGYRLHGLLRNEQMNETSLPPLEKKVWKDLSKTKTTPKIKHFMWRAISGALAVNERLRSRGILVDPICRACGDAEETICHTSLRVL